MAIIIKYILRYIFTRFLMHFVEKLVKWILDRMGKRRF